jgi:hypothetical protein
VGRHERHLHDPLIGRLDRLGDQFVSLRARESDREVEPGRERDERRNRLQAAFMNLSMGVTRRSVAAYKHPTTSIWSARAAAAPSCVSR